MATRNPVHRVFGISDGQREMVKETIYTVMQCTRGMRDAMQDAAENGVHSAEQAAEVACSIGLSASAFKEEEIATVLSVLTLIHKFSDERLTAEAILTMSEDGPADVRGHIEEFDRRMAEK